MYSYIRFFVAIIFAIPTFGASLLAFGIKYLRDTANVPKLAAAVVNPVQADIPIVSPYIANTQLLRS